MTIPSGVAPDCPPGLEYLTQIDQLLIKQQVELLEGIHTNFTVTFIFKIINHGQNY